MIGADGADVCGRCGDAVLAGTDGDGRLTLSCRCGTAYAPRRLASGTAAPVERPAATYRALARQIARLTHGGRYIPRRHDG